MSDLDLVRKAEDFLELVLEGRDESHGIAHAKAVRDNVLKIWDLCDEGEVGELEENANIGIVSLKNAAQIAALLHDVCDHKYISASDNTLAQNNFLNETYDIRTAEVIKLIVQSVSYSKEKKGKLDDVLKSMEHSILFLRNVVSDADKIEALGEIGLERCFQYAKETGSTDEEAWAHVAEHCDDKLLRLLPEYIRTEGGKVLAKEGHDFLQKWRDEWATNNEGKK
ncbi:hypothetical protein TrLO_g11421 [Triparma laevis f. longispina]|uniref:HD domain-containing protein n=1 Tax=Triparma laevis f. longispina TaxID=1714387 RepID=A0A9W6ZV35_9STRA|nr:hypothetical protein TrLO_g11421 [Triparma laevis f. longispina]